MRRIEHSILLDATLELAYDYMTTLKHWRDWYPDIVAMEGQIDVPSAAGETFIERVQTLGFVGKLHWVTLESVRPSRFVIESTSLEMPLIRSAKMRITYKFEPASERLRIRFTRTFEYKFTGVARLLDRIYIHRHLNEKAALALTKLPGIVARAASQRSLTDASA